MGGLYVVSVPQLSDLCGKGFSKTSGALPAVTYGEGVTASEALLQSSAVSTAWILLSGAGEAGQGSLNGG